MACEEKESKEAKLPEVLTDPGVPTPREMRSTESHTNLSDQRLRQDPRPCIACVSRETVSSTRVSPMVVLGCKAILEEVDRVDTRRRAAHAWKKSCETVQRVKTV